MNTTPTQKRTPRPHNRGRGANDVRVVWGRTSVGRVKIGVGMSGGLGLLGWHAVTKQFRPLQLKIFQPRRRDSGLAPLRHGLRTDVAKACHSASAAHFVDEL